MGVIGEERAGRCGAHSPSAPEKALPRKGQLGKTSRVSALGGATQPARAACLQGITRSVNTGWGG